MTRFGVPLTLMFVPLLLFPAAVCGLVIAGPMFQPQAGPSANIALVGGGNMPAVVTSLGIDSQSIHLNQYASIAAAIAAPNTSALVIADVPMGPSDISVLTTFLGFGGGILMLVGPSMTANGTGFQELGITANNNLGASKDQAGVVTRMMNTTHPIMNFDWASAPPTEKMTILPALSSSTEILLANDTGFGTGGAPLLVYTSAGLTGILVFTPWLTINSTAEEPQVNYETVLWPYFNYFLYSASVYLSGQSALTFPEWPFSPVPHFEQQLIIGLIVAVVGVTTVSSYRRMKHKSVAHPEVLTEMERAELLVKTGEITEWEEIGMHRQIGGFLIQLFITLILIIPRTILTVMIYPRYIMPFPQAAGWFSFSVNLFLGLWTVFDLGTAVALAKYFAEYRVSQPEEAVKYAQIFVWWQCLSGVVQITFIAFVGSIVFPHTYLAHLSYVFIAHSLFQFPGFTLLFLYAFQGMNRIDYFQISTILKYAIFDILGPYTVILAFRWWGAQNPIFGEGLAGAIGQAIGSYVSEYLTFAASMYMFKKLGFKASTLFRVDFKWDQIKRALKFGGKWTVGASMVPIVWFYQMLLISTNLLNWSALQGQYELAWNLAIMVSIVGLFMEGMLGGISESYSHGKKKLTEYYTAQALKYGGFFVFWLISSLAAVGARAILGAAGAEWAYAAVLLQFFLIFQILGFWSWLGDWVYAAAERTGLAAAVWVLEQAIRAVAMTYFVITQPTLSITWPIHFSVYLGGMPGIIIGYCIGLFCKDVVAWIVIRRKITKPKFYIWQSYVGPALAALANYAVLEMIAQSIWDGDLITSALIFFLGTIPSLYLFAFVSGITGSWDTKTLGEFKRAAGMVHIRGLGWMARRFYGSVALGARVSPLHNRFPIDVYDSAMIEAEELTREKKKLVI